MEFTKKEMIETLASGYGYVPYSQKHFEDLITKFLGAGGVLQDLGMIFAGCGFPA